MLNIKSNTILKGNKDNVHSYSDGKTTYKKVKSVTLQAVTNDALRNKLNPKYGVQSVQWSYDNKYLVNFNICQHYYMHCISYNLFSPFCILLF